MIKERDEHMKQKSRANQVLTSSAHLLLNVFLLPRSKGAVRVVTAAEKHLAPAAFFDDDVAAIARALHVNFFQYLTRVSAFGKRTAGDKFAVSAGSNH